ncbi:general stress protein [Paenibacillus sp. SYP-B4298]|uniref:general stress protein n=1 Tax=Paenibacillus sp. SYP-B4298 TaxID=2996034 RepID=UPI0022DD935F|nr:general stress protein [Paenibacillus sp. SYP-B4298]
MSKRLALFPNQEAAIQTLKALTEQGFAPGEITVIGKNREHTRRIEMETSVHADELMDIAQTLEQEPSHGAYIVGSMGATAGSSSSGLGAFPAVGAVRYEDMDAGTTMERALDGFGLDKPQHEACSQAIQAGAIAVIVETDEDASDVGGGLGRLDKVEAVFRSHGAQQIV